MSRAPKARTCYICGRPTLLPGYDIHVSKCREIFEQREAQKPPKERRSCPRDPFSSIGSRGFTSLEEENDMIQQQWKSNLAQCANCGRSFLPEKLSIHQRSCTPSNPARSITGTVRSSGTTSDRYDSMATGKQSGKSTGFVGNQYEQFREEASSLANRSLGKSSSGLNQFRDTPEYGHLIKCRECGRNFNPESYEKHAKICRKVFQSKRKPYDSAKHRAEGTELAAYYDGRRRAIGNNRRSSASSSSTSNNYIAGSALAAASAIRSSGAEAVSGKRSRNASNGSKWRQQSSAFREAIRQARLVSQAERKSKATGIPLHALLPADSGRTRFGGGGDGYEVDPSYIQCPHCGRSFNQKAGERHIPQCQNIINKPSRLNRHSGAPSYSTNTPVAARVSSGFGNSTRDTARNNRAVTRWTDDSGGGYMQEMQLMTGSKVHSMKDPVRLNNAQPSFTSSSRGGYGNSGSGSTTFGDSSGGMGGGGVSGRRRSFGSTSSNPQRGGYEYATTAAAGTSKRTSNDVRSSSRPRGGF